MSLKFEFKPTASIDHLNIRKEGSESEILAIDVKLSGYTDSGILPMILGCNPSQARNFWKIKSEDKTISFNGISKISVWSEFDNCEVTIGDHHFNHAKVRKFAFQPQPGLMLELDCQITLSAIAERDISYLCSRIRDDVPVIIGAQPDLFEPDSEDKQ